MDGAGYAVSQPGGVANSGLHSLFVLLFHKKNAMTAKKV
jgi:hypothetical protein